MAFDIVQSVTVLPTFSSSNEFQFLTQFAPPSPGNSCLYIYTSGGYPLDPATSNAIVDTQGNEYTNIQRLVGTGCCVGLIWCPSYEGSGAYQPTLNLSATGSSSASNICIEFLEVSGLAGTVDKSNSGDSTSASTGVTLFNSGADSGTDDFVIACCSTEYAGAVNQAITGPSGGYTSLFSVGGSSYPGTARMASWFENTDTAAGADGTTYGWSTATQFAWAIASFQIGAASGGGSGVPSGLMLLGCG